MIRWLFFLLPPPPPRRDAHAPFALRLICICSLFTFPPYPDPFQLKSIQSAPEKRLLVGVGGGGGSKSLSSHSSRPGHGHGSSSSSSHLHGGGEGSDNANFDKPSSKDDVEMVISWKINATLCFIRYLSENGIFSSTS